MPQRRSGAPGARQPAIIDEVPAGPALQGWPLLVDADARTVADRRRLGFAGTSRSRWRSTRRATLVADPELDLIGIPETDAAATLDR